MARIEAQGWQRLQEELAAVVERQEVVGLTALVATDRAVEVLVLGQQAVDGAPMARDTIMRISSMTKPVIAVATLILIEEGRLALDEPVDRLLPELAERRVLAELTGPLDQTVPAIRPITVRDLLTFRNGFGQVLLDPAQCPVVQVADQLQLGMGPPQPQALPAPDEWLQRLGTLPLMAQPGSQWIYNTGADILSVLIARAAGQPLERFLAERIFAPLGMRDTGFFVPEMTLARFATSYGTNPENGERVVYDPAVGGQWSQPPAFPAGSGGLVSTLDDYYAFTQMLMAGGLAGQTRLLTAASVERLTTNQLTVAQQRSGAPILEAGTGWGFGLAVQTQAVAGGRQAGTYGWDGGLGTSWRTDPQAGLTAILLTQEMWANAGPPAVCQAFAAAAYRALAA